MCVVVTVLHVNVRGGPTKIAEGIACDQVRFCESVAVLSQHRLKRVSWSAE